MTHDKWAPKNPITFQPRQETGFDFTISATLVPPAVPVRFYPGTIEHRAGWPEEELIKTSHDEIEIFGQRLKVLALQGKPIGATFVRFGEGREIQMTPDIMTLVLTIPITILPQE